MSSASLSFPKDQMRVLLLEGIHSAAVEAFENAGYGVEVRGGSLTEAELAEELKSVHLLGIRSKTNVTAKSLEGASRLLAIGCFCIGTDQVALEAAAVQGVPVFNAPFSNTRSVAELVLAEIVMLARRGIQRSMEMHQGEWVKSARDCYEVRGKTLGIVGYGHIGPQVGLLAEALGMRVIYFDIVKKLSLGLAQPVESLEALLKQSDFVSLHVPDTPLTRGMIGQSELEQMPVGSYLLNLSRGCVVDLEALAESLRKGHLAGAAVDVYPEEPESSPGEFSSVLQGIPNVILTPHIGGSTVEAQRSIGVEVAERLVGFSDVGSTRGAVNFPQVDLPVVHESHRLLNVHRNEPGALNAITSVVSATGANIESQYLDTAGPIGFLIMDLNREVSVEAKRAIDKLPVNVRTRLLF